MQLRLMDEVMDLGPRGVALLCAAEDAGALRCGMRLIDARGRGHVVSAVTMQDGLVHAPPAAGRGRLF